MNAWGSPEGELAIAELIIYLLRPKSNSAYTAWGAARKAAREYGSLCPRHTSSTRPPN